MLTTKYSEAQFLELLDNRQWCYLPTYNDEKFWQSRAVQCPEMVQGVLQTAEELLAEPWPELSSELYGEFERNGNRNNFESRYFFRRNALSVWCVAEMLQREGRYLNIIAEHIADIIAEDNWCVPAHNMEIHQRGSKENSYIVDLFAAETAMLLASWWKCIGDELPTADTLGEKIRTTVEQRVLGPVDSGVEYWWLQGRNNWCPWCASNCLIAAAQLWEDRERFARLAYYLSGAVDKFIDKYPSDGGCDEGPGYWNKAAGAMFVFLETLHSCSDGALGIFTEIKIANMANFIQTAHMHNDWFLNFADAYAKMLPAHGLICRFAQRLQSASLQSFAQHIYQLKQQSQEAGVKKFTTGGFWERAVQELVWFKRQDAVQTAVKELCSYLPDTEISVARESSDTSQGFMIAAKGGHNAESHNHNDIGQCVLYHDGKPVLIDVGVGTYTRETFIDETRYALWPIGAQSHNPPIINGLLQKNGEQFHASDCSCENNDDVSTFSLSLIDAYDNKAACTAIDRQVSLQRGASAQVKISDSFTATTDIHSYEIRLVFQVQPKLENNTLYFVDRALSLAFDGNIFTCEIERQHLDDEKLSNQWGDTLWVANFNMRSPRKFLEHSFVFSAQ
ncbi:MAG: heparinase II/III family protein [Planctomycetes bacterium]|nr:heparinase II/III family protein [Planctomycetota bacterium]